MAENRKLLYIRLIPSFQQSVFSQKVQVQNNIKTKLFTAFGQNLDEFRLFLYTIKFKVRCCTKRMQALSFENESQTASKPLLSKPGECRCWNAASTDTG